MFLSEASANDEPAEQPNETSAGIDMVGVIIGSLAALITVLLAIVIFIIFRHKRKKSHHKRDNLKTPVSDGHMSLSLRGSSNGKVLNGHMYSGVAVDDVDTDRECCHGEFLYQYFSFHFLVSQQTILIQMTI